LLEEVFVVNSITFLEDKQDSSLGGVDKYQFLVFLYIINLSTCGFK